MRRIALLLVALSMVAWSTGCRGLQHSSCDENCGRSGGLQARSGCDGEDGCGRAGGRQQRSYSHGICDCSEDDHCSSRMPWLRSNQAASAGGAGQTAPKALPEGKSKN